LAAECQEARTLLSNIAVTTSAGVIALATYAESVGGRSYMRCGSANSTRDTRHTNWKHPA
jgi:hypothetical protein